MVYAARIATNTRYSLVKSEIIVRCVDIDIYIKILTQIYVDIFDIFNTMY